MRINKYASSGFVLLIMLAAMLALIAPTTALAHTGLERAVPASGETVVKEVKAISLQFETKIESLAVLKITDGAGTNIPVKATVGTNSLQGALEAPLKDGKYTVTWRIIGEDSHAIKGSYSFTVKLPQQAASSTPAAKPGDAGTAPDAGTSNTNANSGDTGGANAIAGGNNAGSNVAGNQTTGEAKPGADEEGASTTEGADDSLADGQNASSTASGNTDGAGRQQLDAQNANAQNTGTKAGTSTPVSSETPQNLSTAWIVAIGAACCALLVLMFVGKPGTGKKRDS